MNTLDFSIVHELCDALTCDGQMQLEGGLHWLNVDGCELPIKLLTGAEPVQTINLSGILWRADDSTNDRPVRLRLNVLSTIVIGRLIANNSQLRTLDISRNNPCNYPPRTQQSERIKPSGEVALPTLEGVRAICAALATNHVLTELKLASSYLTDDAAIVIAEALEGRAGVLQILDLSSNLIERRGGRSLFKALTEEEKGCDIGHQGLSLTTLDLHGNDGLFDDGVSVCGVLSTVLLTNSSLTSLSVPGPSTEGIAVVCEGLKCNTSLTALNVSNVDAQGAPTSLNPLKMRSAGAVHLAELLKKNATLTELRLRYHDVSDDGGIALASALDSNSTLQCLDIAGNAVDLGSGLQFSLLPNRSALCKLDLSHNKLTMSADHTLVDDRGRRLKSRDVLRQLRLTADRRTLDFVGLPKAMY